jgi:hypothetical protein
VAAKPDTARKEGERPEKKEKLDSPLVLVPRLPDGDFGFAAPPVAEKLLALTGATIWTCGPQGILENATLVVADGKIVWLRAVNDLGDPPTAGFDGRRRGQ